MRLLSMLMAALAAPFAGPVPASTRNVRLSMPGWVEESPEEGLRGWRDAAGDLLTLGTLDAISTTPFTSSSNPAELGSAARALAEAGGGGLIEAVMVAPPPAAIRRLIYKRLQRPAYVYTGMLTMTGKHSELVWTVVAGEHGTTGVREAVVAGEMISSGGLTLEQYQQSWAQDPYDASYHGVDRSVLRFLSDDPRFDARFPDHPLSKVRRVQAALPGSVSGLQ